MSEINHKKFNEYEEIVTAYKVLWVAKLHIVATLNDSVFLSDDDKHRLKESIHQLTDVISSLNQQRMAARWEFYEND